MPLSRLIVINIINKKTKTKNKLWRRLFIACIFCYLLVTSDNDKTLMIMTMLAMITTLKTIV